MGAIGGLMGMAGGVNGTGFQSPSAAPITPGATPEQLSTAYQGSQNSLASQQALLQALQSQGGLANQSQVYGQLQGVANGTGPNPAQAMLNQQTAQNVQNQAAMMAGQRGAGANVGLMARQAAQNGAQTQQNAIGQGASMQAQQQLAGINAAGTMANTMAGNQIGATSANTQAQQNEQGILQGANSQANNAAVSMQGNMNSVNGQLTNTQMQGQQGMIGGAMQGIGSMLTAPKFAQGGVVQKFADGGPSLGVDYGQAQAPGPSLGVNYGQAAPQQPFNLGVSGWSDPVPVTSGPQSSAGQFLSPQKTDPGSASAAVPSFGGDDAGAQALQQGMAGLSGFAGNSAQNGVSSGKDILGSMGGSGGGGGGGLMALAALSQGGNVGSKLKSGGSVPGKAPVQGNSPKNDIVKADLSPGEGVLDRETMQDQGPVGHTARLLMTIVNAKKKGKK